jgi:hypothetical protein
MHRPPAPKILAAPVALTAREEIWASVSRSLIQSHTPVEDEVSGDNTILIEATVMNLDEAVTSRPTGRSSNSGEISAILIAILNRWIEDPGGWNIKGDPSVWIPPHHPHIPLQSLLLKPMAPPTKTPAASAATVTTTVATKAGPSRQRKGKEIMVESATEEEASPIVVSMGRARSAARNRLIAVGIFMSIIAISSEQLVNYMKKIWKVRGFVETNELADRRFLIEFSEEGDFEHITRGGPWRYGNDAVLVRPLKEGEDPETARFETVSIWTQFRGIPFYLLSKQLAKDMGNKIGSLISIDNNARSDIRDKFLRARVLLPLDWPLLRWIMLEDEITEEVIVVSVFYERLPSFCNFCGLIGHKKEGCNPPTPTPEERYNADIGVQPTHPAERRSWYLPAATGQTRRPSLQALAWHDKASQGKRVEDNTAPRHRRPCSQGGGEAFGSGQGARRGRQDHQQHKGQGRQRHQQAHHPGQTCCGLTKSITTRPTTRPPPLPQQAPSRCPRWKLTLEPPSLARTLLHPMRSKERLGRD